MGQIPENNLDGYGFRLADTAVGQYFSTLKGIPADTIVCVRRAGVMSQAWDPAAYEEYRARYADMLSAMVDFRIPA